MRHEHLTFGYGYCDLREDQQTYVQHLMWSWRATSHGIYYVPALKRAIKKAIQNLP